MNRWSRIALPSLLVLGGCDAGHLSRAADSARAATEHMAENAQRASTDREASVMTQAHNIEQQEAHMLAIENGGRPRYEIRKDGNTWTVYDTENGRPARVGPHLQSGLDHDQAEATFQDLQNEEELDNARMGPPGRPLKIPGAH